MTDMRVRIKSPLFIATVALVSVALAGAAYASIPTAGITPGDGSTGIRPGEKIMIDASPLASIGKVAVYADGELIDIEYNLGTGELTRELDLRAGQTVRVEAKVASPIGLTREVTATFETVGPLLVDEITVDGERLAPGDRMPPLGELAFHFNKPIEQGHVAVDGGDGFELWIDQEDPSIAVLKPFYPLKQGMTHTFYLTAAAEDSAAIEQELLIDVVRPLSLYGQVEDDGAGLRLELYASIPFHDPEALKGMIESDLPDAQVAVEAQKIVITCADPDPSRGYFVALVSAAGRDGSSLEAPLRLSLDMRGGQTQLVGGTGAVTSTGYSVGSGGARAGAGPAAGDGPPPGWPPCCPWPPE
ncbi:MAG: hypothetical protein C4534_06425 [Gaiellales bacterium]|nr:MAG: hypothetical protein C4534_06425 [Gaiellales bacterium]